MIDVVIPVRKRDAFPHEACETLVAQGMPLETRIVRDDGMGASWARQRGFEQGHRPLVLFSDADIRWRPGSVQSLMVSLDAHPWASFAYGPYILNQDGQRHRIGEPPLHFDPTLLYQRNYVSSMVMVRREGFPGWDVTLRRLQDWDLALRFVEAGKRGVNCGLVLFETDWDPHGISAADGWEEAYAELRKRHPKLPEKPARRWPWRQEVSA